MIYEWSCSCHPARKPVEVLCSMRDREVPPDDLHKWKRVVSLPQRLARDSGREGHLWPMRHPHLKDAAGQSMVFQSETALRSFCADQGLVLLKDGDCPTQGTSQKSVYDQARENPPPSEAAETLLSESTFLSDEDLPEEDRGDSAVLARAEAVLPTTPEA